jgi:hypothetical protein
MSQTIDAQQDHAAALRYAEVALAEAERFDCDNEEILLLCDEVIRRRLKLQMRELATGSWPSTAERIQMIRDRLLLNHSITTNRVVHLP